MNIVKLANRAVLKVKKYGPEIAMATSVICGVAAFATTIKQTLKIDEVLDKKEEKLDEMKKALKDSYVDYSEKDFKEDEKKLVVKTRVEIAKLYIVPASLFLTSTGLSICAFLKMRARYLGAVAAYNAVSLSFKEYRRRVVEKDGVEKDFEYMYGTSDPEKIIDENGNEVDVPKGIVGFSPYSIIWSEYLPSGRKNVEWDANEKFNEMFLSANQNTANDILNRRGHIFLNEVLDMIGYPHTKAGSVVGWVKDNPNGDSVVDFGIYNKDTDKAKKILREGDFLLDFNVDGVIWDLI